MRPNKECHPPNSHAVATFWCGPTPTCTRHALHTHIHATSHPTLRPNTPACTQTHGPTLANNQPLRLTPQCHCGDARAGAQGSTEGLQASVRDVFKACVGVSAIDTRPHEERRPPNTHALATCWCGPAPTCTRRAPSSGRAHPHAHRHTAPLMPTH